MYSSTTKCREDKTLKIKSVHFKLDNFTSFEYFAGPFFDVVTHHPATLHMSRYADEPKPNGGERGGWGRGDENEQDE